MFGLFKKKEDKKYYCVDCDEEFTDKHLAVKNYNILRCPFCKSKNCYARSK